MTRYTDQLPGGSQPATAWKALLALDHLARTLRVQMEPDQSYQHILEAAFALLHIQALVWIPQSPAETVLTAGDSGLTADTARQLGQALMQDCKSSAAALFTYNHVWTTSWGANFRPIQTLMAIPLTHPEPFGWLVALNKAEAMPFDRADAALLLPFAGLMELQLRSSYRFQDLKDLVVGLTRSLATALDAKDAYTYGHSERVAQIAVALARDMGLKEDELGDVYLAGLLHDVGKIGIKDTVLHKREALSPEEWEHIQQHVRIGYWILAELRQIRNLLPAVLYHHERYDGTGYPDKLAEENIPLLARILAVADAYDAMSHARPYRDSMPCRQVEQILVDGAGTQWDQQVVQAFLRCREEIHAIRERSEDGTLRTAIDGALRSDCGTLHRTPHMQSQASRRPSRPGERGALAP